MAMKLLQARSVPGVGYRFRVLLDTTKVDAEGNPDREWVAEWTWGATPPAGQTVAQYRAAAVAEVKALAAVELAKRQGEAAGTALANEGEEFG